MKIYNKLIALVAAFGLVGVSYAQDAGGNLTDNISIAGFIDASYSTSESNAAGSTDDEALGIDEVEIDFLFDFDTVTAEVHLDTVQGDGETNDGVSGLDIEQAFVSYDVGNGISVTIGKYGSALGLEREDPGGLYTYSRAYSNNGSTRNLNLGDADNNANEGIRFDYSADSFSVSLSLEDADGADDDDDDKQNTVISVSYTGIENLSIGGGVSSENGSSGSDDITNIHATYSAGKALIAAEYTELDATGSANDVDAMLLLVDYDVSDKLGIAVRYSEEDGSTAARSNEKLSIAPNYALTENLGAILEFSDGEEGTTDVESVALELTLTF